MTASSAAVTAVSHWTIVPIVLPAVVAPLIVLAARHDILLQRIFSLAATAALLAVAVGLLVVAASGEIRVYELGNWPAPFGIVLVLDRLSALMLVLTAVLAFVVLVYAVHGWDARGRHFHPLFQFQLMGLNGAFLTGDVFNLFVFFEVLLIASYGLMLHGGGGERMKNGVQYVVINLSGSTLFLIAVGLIYGVTGTLNLADLAVKVPAVAAADQAILKAGALLLLVVFAVKAAMMPLHFWLPGAYGAAAAPVAALFAIMTKVGGYSILRVYTVAFGEGAGAMAWVAAPWLIPVALVTLALATLGIVGARSLRAMISFALIASMGTLLAAFGVFTAPAISAGLYYLVHSTLIAGGLFLLADLIAERRGAQGDGLVAAPRFAGAELFSALFLLAAMATVGLPPLSGFLAKLLVLDGVRDSGAMVAIWATILVTSLLTLVAFARSGSLLFWKSAALAGAPAPAAPAPRPLPVLAAALLIGTSALLAAFAGPVTVYLDATAQQLVEPAGYIRAVLGRASSAEP